MFINFSRFLRQLLDYYQACVTYYHQGFDLCNDFDEFFKNISEDLNVLRGDYQQLEKVMQNRHMSVNRYCDSNTNSASHNVEGYLFKKKSKGFKTWCRRWFYLSDNQLVYRWVQSMLVIYYVFSHYLLLISFDFSHSVLLGGLTPRLHFIDILYSYCVFFLLLLLLWLIVIDCCAVRWSDLDSHSRKRSNEDSFSVMEEDLRICTVRPVNEGDRRFCFEVISPTKWVVIAESSRG